MFLKKFKMRSSYFHCLRLQEEKGLEEGLEEEKVGFRTR